MSGNNANRIATNNHRLDGVKKLLYGVASLPIQSDTAKRSSNINEYHLVSFKYGKLKLRISVTNGGQSNKVEKNRENTTNSEKAIFLSNLLRSMIITMGSLIRMMAAADSLSSVDAMQDP
jgi:hypothetical protein